MECKFSFQNLRFVFVCASLPAKALHFVRYSEQIHRKIVSAFRCRVSDILLFLHLATSYYECPCRLLFAFMCSVLKLFMSNVLLTCTRSKCTVTQKLFQHFTYICRNSLTSLLLRPLTKNRNLLRWKSETFLKNFLTQLWRLRDTLTNVSDRIDE